jgi:hypothetical protein
MNFRYSAHAVTQMQANGISDSIVQGVLASPHLTTIERNGITCYQSRIVEAFSGKGAKPYLVRVFVNETVNPAIIVTVYRTSKIDKYWKI